MPAQVGHAASGGSGVVRSVAAFGVARSYVVPTANVCSVRSPSLSAVGRRARRRAVNEWWEQMKYIHPPPVLCPIARNKMRLQRFHSHGDTTNIIADADTQRKIDERMY